MLNNSSEEMVCIASIATFTRTSNILERLFSHAKLTLDDLRKRLLPMHFEQQVFPLPTNVNGTFKMLITLFLKLDKCIFLPIKLPTF